MRYRKMVEGDHFNLGALLRENLSIKEVRLCGNLVHSCFLFLVFYRMHCGALVQGLCIARGGAADLCIKGVGSGGGERSWSSTA